jgi:hypothetical protein
LVAWTLAACYISAMNDSMQALMNHEFAKLRARNRAITDAARVCTSVYSDEWDDAGEQLIADYPEDGTREHYAKQVREQLKGMHDVADGFRRLHARRASP